MVVSPLISFFSLSFFSFSSSFLSFPLFLFLLFFFFSAAAPHLSFFSLGFT
ncbi:hypothetical protein Lalb_Chr24g0399831 [Lupinus albus]|uniref:Uncharacterized protein n=1 Tax=Lupinus albus TaxID=3870 RepID=A0A6A4NG05_LUPAL|nr:hypothetical protein Lalb_Chr24g0399831 [Lupinus albus]